jgi:hypothetical protein
MNTGAFMLIDSEARFDRLIEMHMARGDSEETAIEKASRIVEKEEQFDES